MSEAVIPAIDAHRHTWAISERPYHWITPDLEQLRRDFTLEESFAAAADGEISGVVLVQAADSFEDTMYMLQQARRWDAVLGVVGWVPLDRPDEAESALDLFAYAPVVCGVRALTHDYADRQWILRPEVARTIALLPARGLTLDYVGTHPDHLAAASELASRHPDLTIVLDHLGSPPLAAGGWQPWADAMSGIAQHANVVVKLSGLGTCSDPEKWDAKDWQPFVDHALATFGPSRIMIGSDWPVSRLAGTFSEIWSAHRATLHDLSRTEREDVLFGTAQRTYSLGEDRRIA
jgi:L-fuconolactonase